MPSRLREPFGKAGLIVAIVALVASLVGGAYAASSDSSGEASASAKRNAKKRNARRGKQGGLNAKQKRQVIAIAKRFQGSGPAGPQGPAGPAGPGGAKGDKGDKGDNGSNGTDGANGTNGQSVTTATEPPFGNCGEQEGVKLTSASGTNYVCNGAAGTQGPEGSPWTAGGTLPEGKTETGVWSVFGDEDDTFGLFTALSFSIPLAASLPESNVHYVTSPEGPCTGTPGNPTAASGHLCVYETFTQNLTFGEIGHPDGGGQGAGVSGALVGFGFSGAEGTAGLGFGSWAVTG